MRIGIYVGDGAGDDIDAVIARFVRAEEAAFHTAWAGQVFGDDALTVLALAGRTTRRIELGTWVVPTAPRHPVVLAQQARTVQRACGDRLLLGIGVSHREVIEKRLGLAWDAPVRHAEEYLAVLTPLLGDGRVEYSGAAYRVSLRLDAMACAAPPVLLAALGPRMLQLAGSAADGAALWLGGPRYLADFAVPRLRAAAEGVGRAAPRIVCGLPVAVTRDTARGRRAVEAYVSQSARLPAYRRVLAREGAQRPSDVALVGDEAQLARRLGDLAEIGVTDFHAVVVPVEGDPDAYQRTLESLAALAADQSSDARSRETELMQ